MTQVTSTNRAVAYLRAATIEKDTLVRMTHQLRLCRLRARQLGVHLVAVYTDIGRSGASTHRPGLDRLLQELPRRRPRFVVAADAARIARGRKIEAQILRDFALYCARLATAADYHEKGGAA